MVRRGLTQSPESRRVFGVLTVLENLRLGAFTGDKEKAEQTLDWILIRSPVCTSARISLPGRFPAANSRCWPSGVRLMGQPKLLLLDEPSLGLAPLLVSPPLRRSAPSTGPA